MTTALEISHIYKDFIVGDGSILSVLKDISLNIASGDITMIVGPSGCGKTTLLSIISGILTPTKGSILFFGQELTRLTDTEKVTFRKENVGFIFQSYNLIPTLSAVENVAIPLLANGWRYGDALRRSYEGLAHLGLEGKGDKPPLKLSGGEQQRVAIARALVHDPKMVVCDEPTAALDEAVGQRVMELLTKVALNEGRIVVVVTHDPRIYHFADRVVSMNDGQITHIKVERPSAPKKKSQHRETQES